MYKGYLIDGGLPLSEGALTYTNWGPDSFFRNDFAAPGASWHSAAGRLAQIETAFRAAGTTAAPQAVQAAATPPLGVAYELSTGVLAPSTVQLFTHTDPELTKQWHLKWLGDIE